jgi:plasmid stabilization system protein ParE
MRVVIAAAAKADLLAILNYIACDNPTPALSFTEELLDRCQALADTPKAFPLVPRYELFGIRRCVHGNYLIFYRLQPQKIEVIHILQGGKDIEALLFSNPGSPG